MSALYVLIVVMCPYSDPKKCVERPQPDVLTQEYCLTQGMNISKIFMIRQHGWFLDSWRCEKRENGK